MVAPWICTTTALAIATRTLTYGSALVTGEPSLCRLIPVVVVVVVVVRNKNYQSRKDIFIYDACFQAPVAIDKPDNRSCGASKRASRRHATVTREANTFCCIASSHTCLVLTLV